MEAKLEGTVTIKMSIEDAVAIKRCVGSLSWNVMLRRGHHDEAIRSFFSLYDALTDTLKEVSAND